MELKRKGANIIKKKYPYCLGRLLQEKTLGKIINFLL